MYNSSSYDIIKQQGTSRENLRKTQVTNKRLKNARKMGVRNYARDNSTEYQKRANFPENIEFSGISLYSDKSIRHHKNTRNFNGN